jgi:Mg-chelatase subunit ChlD
MSRLEDFEYFLLIDSSGSMSEPIRKGSSVTRWESMQETAMDFSRDLDKLDSNGTTVITFGRSVEVFHNVTSAKVREVFETVSPRGGTPSAEAFKMAVAEARKAGRKSILMMWTDGRPSDPEAFAAAIIEASNSLEADDELTLLIIQIGDEPSATTYLKSLDNDLRGAKFDIVDVRTVQEAEAFANTTALLEAAIVD